MATQTLITRFQLKRGLSEAWERNNPVLAPGEPGWTLDTHILKIGDGTTTWKDLESIGGVELREEDIKDYVYQYLTEHPVTVITDKTLTKKDVPADSEAVRDQCVFNSDKIIFCAGDADDNDF